MPDIRRILLAEDNANDVELTLSALQSHHVANEVIVVRDGVEALDYLFRRGPFSGRDADDPGLMLLDLKMPKMDGLEVLRHVKADARLRRLPIVVLTSSREESDVVRSYDLGVNAYVVKPVKFSDFVEAVHTLGAFWAVLNEMPPPS